MLSLSLELLSIRLDPIDSFLSWYCIQVSCYRSWVLVHAEQPPVPSQSICLMVLTLLPADRHVDLGVARPSIAQWSILIADSPQQAFICRSNFFRWIAITIKLRMSPSAQFVWIATNSAKSRWKADGYAMDVHLIQPVSTWRLHRSTVENSSPMSNNEKPYDRSSEERSNRAPSIYCRFNFRW